MPIKCKIKDLQHLTPAEKEALRVLIEMAREHFTINRVLLFGSRARGDYNEDSDVDVMFVVENKVDYKVSDVLYGLAADINIPRDTYISAKMKNKDFWESSKDWGLVKNIEREGIEIDWE